MQLQTTSPESKFPNEYTDAIFIQIHQHLKKLLPKTKGSRFYETWGSYYPALAGSNQTSECLSISTSEAKCHGTKFPTLTKP